MDTNELKKLLKGSTAVLILDNGEPTFVVLGYDSYKNLLSDQEKEVKINHPATTGIESVFNKEASSAGVFQHRIGEKEAELLEKINKEILSLKNEIEKEEKDTAVDG